MDDTQVRLKALRGHDEEITSKIKAIDAGQRGLKIIEDFKDMVNDGAEIQKAQSSMFHKATEGLVFLKDFGVHRNMVQRAIDSGQVFLVQNDWRLLIEGTEAIDGEFQYPSDPMIVEFQIGGKRLIQIYSDEWGCDFFQGDQTFVLNAPYQLTSELFNGGPPEIVRAMCICLEAQVAEVETIRAPHRLNERRQKNGKSLIRGHHIVKLMNRRRYEALPDAENNRRSPRLHFRRGHWRHFESHKTWIRWQLVGDESLGFVDKTYLA